MCNDTILKIIKEIRDLLLQNKELLTIDEFCRYSGYEKSYVYKLVNQKKIPYCKPKGGKSLFFKKTDIISFLTAVKIDPYDLAISENRNEMLN